MLPDAIVRAFPADTQEKLGGLAQLAGVDLELALLPRKIVDHPWLGLEVTFPFPEVGTGRVVSCLTHPRGSLMFDVEFPRPVPPVNAWGPYDGRPGGCEAVLVDRPAYHETTHRFHGCELRAVVNGAWTPYRTVGGVRVPLREGPEPCPSSS